jgi:alkylhydroperoxidase family enzyme
MRSTSEVYEKVRSQFSEKEVVSLTFAIVAINGWNRLAISLRQIPGDPRAAQRAEAAAASA